MQTCIDFNANNEINGSNDNAGEEKKITSSPFIHIELKMGEGNALDWKREERGGNALECLRKGIPSPSGIPSTPPF